METSPEIQDVLHHLLLESPETSPEKMVVLVDRTMSMEYCYEPTHNIKLNKLSDMIAAVMHHRYNARVFMYDCDLCGVDLTPGSVEELMEQLGLCEATSRVENPAIALEWLAFNRIQADRIVFVTDNKHPFNALEFRGAALKYYHKANQDAQIVLVVLDHQELRSSTIEDPLLFKWSIVSGFGSKIIHEILASNP